MPLTLLGNRPQRQVFLKSYPTPPTPKPLWKTETLTFKTRTLCRRRRDVRNKELIFERAKTERIRQLLHESWTVLSNTSPLWMFDRWHCQRDCAFQVQQQQQCRKRQQREASGGCASRWPRERLDSSVRSLAKCCKRICCANEALVAPYRAMLRYHRDNCATSHLKKKHKIVLWYYRYKHCAIWKVLLLGL